MRQRAERYLYCPLEDCETLRDAISPRDLTGVGELIVRRPDSPRLTPKHQRKQHLHPAARTSPVMSLKMDDGLNGKHHAPSRIPGPKSGSGSKSIPGPKSGRYQVSPSIHPWTPVSSSTHPHLAPLYIHVPYSNYSNQIGFASALNSRN